ncbi:MAG: hypothetical protein ABI445_21865 [Polyangia bacterium]
MSRYLIYGLRDPRTGAIRYVGQSSSGMRRPRAHGQAYFLKRTTPHKRNWLMQLASLGLKHEVVVLQQLASKDGLHDAEVFWVALGRAALGDKLLNSTAGGETVYVPTIAERERHASIMGSPDVQRRALTTRKQAQAAREGFSFWFCDKRTGRQVRPSKLPIPAVTRDRAPCPVCGETDPDERYDTTSRCRSCMRKYMISLKARRASVSA